MHENKNILNSSDFTDFFLDPFDLRESVLIELLPELGVLSLTTFSQVAILLLHSYSNQKGQASLSKVRRVYYVIIVNVEIRTYKVSLLLIDYAH